MSSRRRGVTEQAAAAAIESGTRALRLPTIRDRFTEFAAAAEREQMSYLGFLAELVMAECDDRDKRRASRRIHDAGFPRVKRLEEFDFTANPAINPAAIHQLATCAWVREGHPLCLIGDSGTGKSHLLIALGTVAAETGYRGPLHPRLEAGQRAGRGRRRQAAVQDHRPLRPGRPALPRRARLHGT
jgi:DNA replication protein DnaC